MYKNLFILFLLFACYQCTDDGPADLTGLPEYKGEALRNVFYPLGGIGTGNILMGGRGNILELEIFNGTSRDELPPYMSFFSVWYQEKGEEPGSMVLERKYFDNFTNGFGTSRQQLSGLPRFEEARWSGAPPFMYLALEDNRVPLDIRMECFNPLIPLDVEGSSLPVGEFSWIISNPGATSVNFSVAFNISNPFKNLNYRRPKPGYSTRNSLYKDEGTTGVFFENLIDPADPDFGNMVVATDHAGEEIVSGLPSERWWDDAHIIWGEFANDGHITEKREPITDAGSRDVVSSILVHGELGPGEIDTVRYYVTWYVPNRQLETNQAFGVHDIIHSNTLNHYARRFEDARNVLGHYLSERERLKSQSRKFFSALTGSTMPVPVLDAAASNLAILKSNLIFRVENGDVHGYEGMGNDFGCCPGNCTHVWNYAQTMASLFPSLERNIRETAFLTQTFESGYQSFRTTFPIGDHHFMNVAADGQMGNIMRIYREWKFSGDSLWLAKLWPAVKRSLEYAWNGSREDSREAEWTSHFTPWDPDRIGVLTSKQHNTYDIDFYGPNMLTGGLYLGALKACSEMAAFLGDGSSALYLEVYESGRSTYDSLLWNGSWYEQRVEEGHDRYQYGSGCLSDQLLGQYLAFNSGMGYILDSAKVKRCLLSIYKHNYIPDFSNFHNVQRVYALNDDGGLVLCSWPDGNRELTPFPYADEVWTGVEYQVATSLIRAGLVEEGLEIVEAVRKRYAGYNRNPYAEIESGFYYARALSSWSVLLALSGFEYDGVDHIISFNPAINAENFNTFWSCGSGWGNYTQTVAGVELEVDFGELGLRELSIGDAMDSNPIRVSINELEVDDKIIHEILQHFSAQSPSDDCSDPQG